MLRGIESLIQYNFSGAEEQRLVQTEKMGDARSPFSHNELLEALYDPSFNVRYQAINSISRMDPEPELIDGLIDILEDDPSELSFVITRALGRLGDKRAIKPLRKYLQSGYHLIEANSARALAMLDDKEVVPILLDKMRQESNPTLRVAYATALGKLKGIEAVQDMFLLLEELHGEVQRGEVELALARISGSEEFFTNQWRAIRFDPTTGFAQATMSVQRLTNDSGFVEMATEASGHFAENKMEEAAEKLLVMLKILPAGVLDPLLDQMIQGCTKLLEVNGCRRRDYMLLTLHMLETALRA